MGNTMNPDQLKALATELAKHVKSENDIGGIAQGLQAPVHLQEPNPPDVSG